MATLDLDVNLTYSTFRGRLGCLGKCLKQVKWWISGKISENFLVWKYLQNIFLDYFSKSKTMRNFLSAIDIQFLYGWKYSSTVRQPGFTVELLFCSLCFHKWVKCEYPWVLFIFWILLLLKQALVFVCQLLQKLTFSMNNSF